MFHKALRGGHVFLDIINLYQFYTIFFYLLYVCVCVCVCVCVFVCVLVCVSVFLKLISVVAAAADKGYYKV